MGFFVFDVQKTLHTQKFCKLFALMLALLSVGLGHADDNVSTERPNIVIVLVDDMGFSDVG